MKSEIMGYEPFVDDVKELIHQKQYHVLKVINAETINLYWEIGEEIYRQQEEKGWGKSIVEYALKQSNAPIGVATYQLSNTSPENMKELLPAPEEIAKRLKIFENE